MAKRLTSFEYLATRWHSDPSNEYGGNWLLMSSLLAAAGVIDQLICFDEPRLVGTAQMNKIELLFFTFDQLATSIKMIQFIPASHRKSQWKKTHV